MPDVDVGVVADFRFPGGTSTAVYHELRAFRRAGVSVALALLDACCLTRGRPPNPRLAALLAAEDFAVLPAHADCTCRVLLAHHPALFQHPPARRLPLRAEHVFLVAHHPAVDRDGRQSYDYDRAAAVMAECLGRTPVLLPVSAAVRRSLEDAGVAVEIAAEDWTNLIDAAATPALTERAPGGTLRIGRHSRPDPLKWPEPELARRAYPERADLDFVMLGVDAALRERFVPWPLNWQGLPFRPNGVEAFLAALDAYAYFHHPRWVEAFGYNVLEALAAGLPTLIGPELRATFGDGPLYAAPDEAEAVYDRLLADPGFAREAGAGARAAAGRFDYARMAERLRRLSGPTATPLRHRARPPRRPDTILAVTSNGVGAGHIMRQIAVARAAGPDVRTVFFTLSRAAGFAHEAGFLAEARPFHRSLGMDATAWNAWFRRQLLEAFAVYRPDVLVFDGNVPYAGLLDALNHAGGPRAVWMRRAMWRRPEEASASREARFDLILEPGELAAACDPGHSRVGGAPCVTLQSILPVDPRQRLRRDTARRLLGLPREGFVLLLALGSGANRDIAPARARVVDAFTDATVVEPINPLATPMPPVAPHHRQVLVFPIARYLAAFDAAIVAAGYNSFHEMLEAALPTLFVPNADSEMDLQEARADHAARSGWALAARLTDPYGLDRALAALAEPDEREKLAAACRALPDAWDGAAQAARHVAWVARQTGRAAA